MKRIQILAILSIALISSLIIYSCSKDKKEINDAPQKVLNFKENKISVAYASTIDNGFLNFSINIQDEESGKGIKEDFAINTDKKQLSKEISKQITDKQKALSSKFTASEISKILTVMNNMINSLTVNIADNELLDLKVQGLFMSKSLVQSINRQILKNNQNSSFSVSSIRNEFLDAEIFTSNTVYEGFNRGFSTFTLSEDLVVNVSEFSSAMSQGSQSTSQEFQFIQTVVSGLNKNNITVFELEQELVRYTINNPEKFDGAPSTFGYKWPKGSDHGCCGNYDGDCYYFHPICYLHDKLCKHCTPKWLCLPGCKKDKPVQKIEE
jgi:hypothetical protein